MSCNRIPNGKRRAAPRVKRAVRAVGRAVRGGARRAATAVRRVRVAVRRKPNPGELYVYGTKGLGLDLHQWHASMGDPIYALGSSWYVGRGVPLPVAEAAAENLERMAARGHKTASLARKVRARIRAARRSNPAIECDYLTGGPRTHLGEKVTLYGRRWHLQRCHTPVRGRSAWLGVDPQGATRPIVKQAVRNKTYRGKGPVASRPKPKKRGKR